MGDDYENQNLSLDINRDSDKDSTQTANVSTGYTNRALSKENDRTLFDPCKIAFGSPTATYCQLIQHFHCYCFKSIYF